MQLTIDSSQPLEDVLRVVGAMYQVDLSVPPGNGNNSQRTLRQRRASSARRKKLPTTAEVRAWALSEGYEVGSKGRIADSVVDAYLASNS